MSASVDSIALIVAILALVIALLQVIQQYVASSEVHAKCNEAAIGGWSSKNRYGWNHREWKLRVSYRPFQITRSIFFETLRPREIMEDNTKHSGCAELSSYEVSYTTVLEDSPQGPRLNCPPSIVLRTRGEDPKVVSLHDLSRRGQAAVTVLQKKIDKEYAPPVPVKATWCNLMNDLGVDLHTWTSEEHVYFDAETIPSTLDAPSIQIHLSDLIAFGLLLDMTIVEVDSLTRTVTMTGKHCSITTSKYDRIGMVSQYSNSRFHQPVVRRATILELYMSSRLAEGYMYVGDFIGPVSDWGYNSIDALCSSAIIKAGGNQRWQQIEVTDMSIIEPDSDVRWGGKWSQTCTPVTALVMSVCNSMAISNAIPHRLLEWSFASRKAAAVNAYHLLETGIGLIMAPDSLTEQLKERGDVDVVLWNHWKTANNYGCEYGGARSWLSTNLSEFTMRMSKVWVVDRMTDHVPILPQISPFLKDGTLSVGWREEPEFEKWTPNASTLLWLQITMLDTWISHHIHIIMGSPEDDEAAVPADQATAKAYAAKPRGIPDHATAWHPVRLQFARDYLGILADGDLGVVASCMSPGFEPEVVIETKPKCWDSMPTGKPADWTAIDAVLTLRAVLMYVRLESLKDSSVFLELRRVLDPVITLI